MITGWKRSLAALVVVLWPTSLAAAPAGDLDLMYEIHIGGLFMGTLRVHTSIGGGAYHLRSDLRTAGLVGWLTGFTSLAVSDGVLAADGPRPSAHRADNQWRGDKRWSEQRYRAGLPAVGTLFPSQSDDERKPVPPEQTIGTVDPLTAGLALSAVAGSGTAEPRIIPVFDGRRRYDLIATPEAAETITAPAYAGLAQVVDVSMRRIAGFSPSPFFPPPKEGDKARLWFVPAPPGGLPHHGVPVRMRSDGPLGMVVVNLVRLPSTD